MNKRLKMGLAGRYKFEAVSPEGERVVLADWFSNVVTFAGLDRMAVGGCGEWCQLGTGTKVAEQTDTNLSDLVVATSNIDGFAVGAAETSPYYGWHRTIYRFDPGVVVGDITEVGVGWWPPTGNLFSRALIVDAFGEPTSISVPTGYYLNVTYELRLYPIDEGDVSLSVVISGSTYGLSVRPAELNKWESWSPMNVQANGMLPADGGDWGTVVMYDGNMGSILSTPSGSVALASSLSAAAYVPGSYERTFTMTVATGNGNFATGIKSMLFTTGVGWAGMWQGQFTPAIPKTSSNVLTFKFTLQWYGVPL